MTISFTVPCICKGRCSFKQTQIGDKLIESECRRRPRLSAPVVPEREEDFRAASAPDARSSIDLPAILARA